MDLGNFIFLGVSSNFVDPQKELLNFGLQVKEEVVENFKNPTIFWRAVGTNFVKIWRFSKNKSSKSNDFGLGHFYFTKKPLNEIWH